MLKHNIVNRSSSNYFQPPSGGCVLKLLPIQTRVCWRSQPPSGGCVLKLLIVDTDTFKRFPAAFGRLCVETDGRLTVHFGTGQPPSGGCVLKQEAAKRRRCIGAQPPSGGCVLKRRSYPALPFSIMVPAAFGRLCVETSMVRTNTASPSQPPSGGCVLKLREFS